MRIVLPDSVDEVKYCVENGGIVFIPTDTIYGISARADDENILVRVSNLKGRGDKPFILITDDFEKLNSYIEAEDFFKFKKAMDKFDLYSITFILRAKERFSHITSSDNGIAFRLIKSGFCGELLSKVSFPLISTSANPSGKIPADSVESALAYFGERIDIYVDSGKISGFPSTIIDLRKGAKILRKGKIFPDKRFFLFFSDIAQGI